MGIHKGGFDMGLIRRVVSGVGACSIRSRLAGWLFILAVMLGGVEALAAPRITTALGPAPHPYSRAYASYIDRIETYAVTANPVARATTYYINQSGSGSAAGGGGASVGTLANPWLVRDNTDLSALIAANDAPGVAFLLRCGDVFRTNETTPNGSYVAITTANMTLGAYVDANVTSARNRLRKPEITGFAAPVTSGWTQVGATNWWYRDYTSATRPFGVRFSDSDATRGESDKFKFLDKTTGGSTGGAFTSAVDAELTGATVLGDTAAENAFTIVHDSGTPQYRLYIKLATLGSPNTATSIEVMLGVGLGGVWVGDVDGVRIDGLNVTGYGVGIHSGGATSWFGTQAPPILFAGTGTNLCVVTGCDAQYSGTHLIEHYAAGAGGSFVAINCGTGGTSAGSSSTTTQFEGFSVEASNTNDQEFVVIAPRMIYGQLYTKSAWTSGGLYSDGRNILCDLSYNHTNNAAYQPALTLMAYGTIDPSVRSNGYVRLGGGNAQALSTITDPRTARFINFGCTAKGAAVSAQLVANTLHVNCAVQGMGGDLSLAGNHQVLGGSTDAYIYLCNTEHVIDMRSNTSAYPYIYSGSGGSNNYGVMGLHSRMVILVKDKGQCIQFVNPSDVATRCSLQRWINGEAYCTAYGASSLYVANSLPNFFNLPNQTCTESLGGSSNSAFVGWQPVNVSAQFGYQTAAGYRDHSNTPALSIVTGNQINRDLVGLAGASPVANLMTDMDMSGNLRRSPSTIGPKEWVFGKTPARRITIGE